MRDITQDDVRKAALDLIDSVDKWPGSADDCSENLRASMLNSYIDGVCEMANRVIAKIDEREAEAERELEEWRRKQAEKAAAGEA